MRRLVCLCCLVIGLSATRAAAQITVTAPSGGANAVASANDFATQVFQDPWDMNERSDLGWWLNSVDFPYNGFSSANFSGGLFSGTIKADPNVWLLETNLDDLPAEVIGYCQERLFAAGALDVFTTAIFMKKNRPGVMLSVLAAHDALPQMEEILFRETTTLGIRRQLIVVVQQGDELPARKLQRLIRGSRDAGIAPWTDHADARIMTLQLG